MIILEHSTYDAETIAANLGVAEYSYWFVRNAFRSALAAFGTVIAIADPSAEADAIYRKAQARDEACVLMSYNPPQHTPLGLACPTVPVFAWEFDRIPDEPCGSNPQDDWRVALAQTGVAITHCGSAVEAVHRAMGDRYPVWSIPAPMFEAGAPHRNSARGRCDGIAVPLDGCVAIDLGATDLSLFAPHRWRSDGAGALRLLEFELRRVGRSPRPLVLSGVVYTAVLNPADGRKNWADMVGAFVAAFRDDPDATLVVKLTHYDLQEGMLNMLSHAARLGRFTCRVVLIHGMLSDTAYAALIAASSFTVNTSSGEGQCLPLMEFMSAGRPAVSPRHSAMRDYISPANAFVVASHPYPAIWPHDERQALRCMRHDIDFMDLVARYRESFAVAAGAPERYRRMSANAVDALRDFCSAEIVHDRLDALFATLAARRPASVASGAATPPTRDPYVTGLHDAALSGWYQEDSDELLTGFRISADDVVVDVGCGDGGVVAFCARRGAHLVLADIDAARLAATTDRLRASAARQVDAHVTDGNPLPIADETGTRIICMEVLEHVDDPDAFVAELVRIGKPGARYLISVPGEQSEILQTDLAPPGYFDKPNHVRIFGERQLHELVERAGLVIEHRDRYGFFWAFLLGMFWQEDIPLGETRPNFDAWGGLWTSILAGKDGLRIKRAFDNLMPKVQMVVARKPERTNAA